MKLIKLMVLVPMMMAFSLALANEHMSDEQMEVWEVVAASWEDETNETGAWPGEYVHEDAHSWSTEWPVPRDATSMAAWSRFSEDYNQTLNYELFPLQVTVAGDTAVVYYFSVQVTESGDDERERSTTGLVETLVQTDAGWKFVGLSSFTQGDSD